MADLNKLKTKRDRIIHNERMKYWATYCVGFAIAFTFGILFSIVATAERAHHFGAWSLVWEGAIGVAVAATIVGALLYAGHLLLGDLVDIDAQPANARQRKRAR